jgi:hypothetical protein
MMVTEPNLGAGIVLNPIRLPRRRFERRVLATRGQLRDTVSARPFRPYAITLADVQTFTVRHPELVSCDMRGRDLQISVENGLFRVEMRLVTSMRQIEPGNDSKQQNGG